MCKYNKNYNIFIRKSKINEKQIKGQNSKNFKRNLHNR